MRIDPPVSEPMAPSATPAATAAPEPLLEPPVKCSVFQGLRAGGHGASKDGPPWAYSDVASLPRSTAPDSRSFAAAAASSRGMLPTPIFECPEVSMPAVL